MLNSTLSQSSADVRSRQGMGSVRFLAALAAVAVSLPASPAQAFPWGDFIRQGVQVLQFSNLSTRNEVALGNQIHNNLVSQGMKLYQNQAVNAYVNRVGQRLVSRSQGHRDYSYIFQVALDSRVNAFATMGGRVYVTTGLLKAAGNEAELASVLGHEIAHVKERHLVKQIRQRTLTTGLIGTATGLSQSQAANIGIELLVNRPKGRGDEYEADQVGLEILRQAGYAPSAAPAFMKKLLSDKRTPTFLSTHPAVPDRLKALQDSIEKDSTHSCDRNPNLQSCGLDVQSYQQNVINRL
ncbi:MAG: M48 family metallopeptidase [Cyanobacteria bacterium P01_A01_bin.17]